MGVGGGGYGGQNFKKIWKIYQLTGQNGTTFGIHVRIHLGMDIHRLKTTSPSIAQRALGVGLWVKKVWGNYETDAPIGTKFVTRLKVHLGIDIG